MAWSQGLSPRWVPRSLTEAHRGCWASLSPEPAAQDCRGVVGREPPLPVGLRGHLLCPPRKRAGGPQEGGACRGTPGACPPSPTVLPLPVDPQWALGGVVGGHAELQRRHAGEVPVICETQGATCDPAVPTGPGGPAEASVGPRHRLPRFLFPPGLRRGAAAGREGGGFHAWGGHGRVQAQSQPPGKRACSRVWAEEDSGQIPGGLGWAGRRSRQPRPSAHPACISGARRHRCCSVKGLGSPGTWGPAAPPPPGARWGYSGARPLQTSASGWTPPGPCRRQPC